MTGGCGATSGVHVENDLGIREGEAATVIQEAWQGRRREVLVGL